MHKLRSWPICSVDRLGRLCKLRIGPIRFWYRRVFLHKLCNRLQFVGGGIHLYSLNSNYSHVRCRLRSCSFSFKLHCMHCWYLLSSWRYCLYFMRRWKVLGHYNSKFVYVMFCGFFHRGRYWCDNLCGMRYGQVRSRDG